MIFKKPIIAISSPLIKSSVIVIKISFGSIKNLNYISWILFKKKLIKNKINYVKIYYKNKIIEKCIVLYFKKPKSYTGENLYEIHLHGNPFLAKNIFKIILKLLKIYRIKIAKPGDFTKRGFINKKFNIYDVEKIYNISNFSNLNNLKNIFSDFSFNLKKKFKKFLFFLKNLKNFIYKNFLKFNINKNYSIKKFKYIILKLKNLNKKFFNLNLNNSSILIGNTNVGKSTLLNKIIKSNIIISNLKGTTRDILSFKLKFKNNFLKIKDSPGFILNFKSLLDLNSIFLSIKNIKFSYIIFFIYNLNKLYFLKNYIYYNYLKNKFLKNKYFLNIYNKIDLFLIKIFSNFEFIFFKNYYIFFKISSKNYLGLIFIYNELKRLSYNLSIFKKYFYKSFYFKFLKKSIINISKSLHYYKKKNIFLSFKFLKISEKYLFKIIYQKKLKNLNKFFNKFCFGK